MKKRILLIMAALSLFAYLFANSANSDVINPKLGTQYALLISIGDYPHATKLLYPRQDAKKMNAFFQQDLEIPAKNIQRLNDMDATRKNILKAFDTLQQQLKKNDQLLIYYSGHGNQIRDKNNDEADGWDEALVSFDAQFDVDTAQWTNVISDDELDQILTKIEAKGVNTVMITDACHSGSITRSIAGAKTLNAPNSIPKDLLLVVESDTYKQRRKETPFLKVSAKRIEWSAASSGELAYEDRKIGGGIFTHYFLQGLKEKKADRNKNGIVSNSELIQYLQKKSALYCKNTKRCAEQPYQLTPKLTITKSRYGEPVFPAWYTRQPPPETKDKREKMLTILEQTLPQNQADNLSIRITAGKQLRFNDDIFVKITSKKAGYLILLDLDAKGELVQVFPNQYHSDNAIKANQPHYVPEDALQAYAMTANEVGKSHLYAIVTHDKVDLSDYYVRS